MAHTTHAELPNYGAVPAQVAPGYAQPVRDQLLADAQQVIARYPQPESALLPLLHLVQSVEGYVSTTGIEFCAEVLGLTAAEVSGVATFYTQYKRHPNGEYTVGVCTNTLCAVMGGDEIWERVSSHLDIGHDETTPDGKITLERVECNAACDYAPVVMANWEFFDNQTPASATQLVDDLRSGVPVRPTRGASQVCTFKQVSRVLAGFSDGRADEGVGAGPASLVGLRIAAERGWQAPVNEREGEQMSGDGAAQDGAMAPGRHSSQDTPANEPDELPGAEGSAKDQPAGGTGSAPGAGAGARSDGAGTGNGTTSPAKGSQEGTA